MKTKERLEKNILNLKGYSFPSLDEIVLGIYCTAR